ncbi:hypothetical protein FS837_004245 [Tulasnella sp. UAMH 9824]|nr:hypothetical protein FS837_004245 [Tulasnella sp. UAMH 9824]
MAGLDRHALLQHNPIDPETSALPSKALQHVPQSLYVDGRTQALVNGPIPTSSGGEDRLGPEEAQVRAPGGAQFRTSAAVTAIMKLNVDRTLVSFVSVAHP